MGFEAILDQFSDAFLLAPARGRRCRFLLNPELRKTFEREREMILQLFEDTEYYHGTGACHYVHEGGSKYGERMNTVGDSLGSFLKEGLKLQEDIFNEAFKTGVNASISLTRLRVYARLYADLYMAEGERLFYEYGSREAWWRMLLLRMGLSAIRDVEYMNRQWELFKERIALRTRSGYLERRRKQVGMARCWSHSFRADSKYDSYPISLLLNAKSDVRKNFAVIIGVKNGVVRPLKMAVSSDAICEVRSGVDLRPEQFSHLEVPFVKMEEVRERVDELGLSIPVTPIEFAELVDSEKRLGDLLTV